MLGARCRQIPVRAMTEFLHALANSLP